MYINGMKQEMDEDLFDEMAEALHQSSNLHNPPTATSTRWDVVEPLPTTLSSRRKPDGTYDKKPNDPKWVCLKMGYTPNYSHLVGIMIINHWV